MRVQRATAARYAAALLVAALAAVACSDPGGEAFQPGSTDPAPSAERAPESVGPDGTADAGAGAGVAVRDDVDCSADGLDDTGEFDFTTARYVVDGALGALCHGEEDPTLQQAWEVLADIVPPGQLRDLALFGGFSDDAAEEEPTLAFVNAREDSDGFQMSVNLQQAEQYPEDLPLTMVHEFAHVFTGVPGELDRTVTPEECATWDNGEGCYVPGSIMDAWTAEFWAGELESVDPEGEPTTEEGQDRCDTDGGFFGAYGASHPEEDFAEAFAAWVLRVPAANDDQQRRYGFMEQRPGLLEFRSRAELAGYGPEANNFDECGLGR